MRDDYPEFNADRRLFGVMRTQHIQRHGDSSPNQRLVTRQLPEYERNKAGTKPMAPAFSYSIFL
jgi:hypothetical protein